MYYQEKKTIVSIVEGIAVLTAYCIYTFGKINADAALLHDIKFLAVNMLVFIGIGIAFTIAIQVVFHILMSVSIAVRERDKDGKEIESAINAEMVEDERDKLIELKSARVQMIISMIGFVAGLVLLAFDYSVGVMLNILFIAACLGAIGEGVAMLVYYKVGSYRG